MALNFGFLGNLSRALPGYIEGQRQAIQDNWQDLKNWNEVYSGQLGNMYANQTYPLRLSREYDLAMMSQYGREKSRGDIEQYRAYLPGAVRRAKIRGELAPVNEAALFQHTMNMMRNPFLYSQGMNPMQWYGGMNLPEIGFGF